MTVSYRDLILESKDFQYSKEYFELNKACTELMLMEKYLATQKFLLDKVSTGTLALTESFYVEAVDPEHIKVLEERLAVKFESVGESIKKGLKAIIAAVKNFFLKIAGKYDTVTGRGTKVLKDLQKKTLTPADTLHIDGILIRAEQTTKIKAHPNQEFNVDIAFPAAEGVNTGMTTARLAVALSNKTVNLDVLSDETGTNIAGDKVFALNVDALKDALDLVVGREGSPAAIGSALTRITGEWASSKTKGLKVDIDTPKIKAIVDELTKFDAKLSAAQAQDTTLANVAGNAAAAVAPTMVSPGAGADAAAQISDLYAKVKGALGQTMATYSGLIQYRASVITELETYLKAGIPAAQAPPAETPPAETPPGDPPVATPPPVDAGAAAQDAADAAAAAAVPPPVT